MKKFINLKSLKPKKKYIADYVLMAMLLVATTVTVNKFAQLQNKGEVIQVSNTKKKLPIYSVDTPDKKMSISFDAAWANVRLMDKLEDKI